MATKPLVEDDTFERTSLVSRRKTSRLPTIYRLARVSDGVRQGLVKLNNISDGGLCFSSADSFRSGTRLTIHLADAVSIEGHVVWSAGSATGVAFDRIVDCRALLSESTGWNRRTQGKGLTLVLDAPAELMLDDRRLAVRLQELTPHCCKISSSTDLSRGQLLLATIGPNVTVKAVVCGKSESGYDLLFCEAIDVVRMGWFT